MEDVALNTLKPTVSLESLALAKSAIDALGKLTASDRARILFDSNSTASSKRGVFQVVVCDESSPGRLSVEVGLFYFYGHKHDPRFLWNPVPKDVLLTGHMTSGRNTYHLKQDVYAKVRDEITERLGDKFKTLVAAVDMLEFNTFLV